MAALNNLKWYTTFFFLIGAILSFADPVTDALTLAEYYKENHIRWFRWGLVFMIAPCPVFWIVKIISDGGFSLPIDSPGMALFRCNPFSPAWASFKAFLLCMKNFKKLWRGDEEVDSEFDEIDLFDDTNGLIRYVKLAQFAEAIMESVPQFIIQLYAANVQEEAVKIIQIISLSVSCLSIVWAFTAADDFLHEREIEVKIKDKVLFFIGNFFFLTSRLLAICYFILRFRTLIVVILLIHSFIVTVFDCDPCDFRDYMFGMFFLLFRWIRDDICVPVDQENIAKRRRRLRKIQWLCHVMFVMENIAIILLVYNLSKFSNNWYAFPVTVYVCTASILGSSIRLVHFRF